MYWPSRPNDLRRNDAHKGIIRTVSVQVFIDTSFVCRWDGIAGDFIHPSNFNLTMIYVE
jgi:hypothetical protein